MANPIISRTGAANGFLLVTDQAGLDHRILKTALSDIVDSSNSRVFRLDVLLAGGEITLLFDTSSALDSFLSNLDSFY